MKEILCTIYGSSKEAELYLYMKRGEALDSIPEELTKRMGKIHEVMTLLINEDKHLARVKAKQVLGEIEEKGYFLQFPPTFNPHLTYGE